MNKNELKEGEIYYVLSGSFWMIGLITKSNNGQNDYNSLRENATFISVKEDFKKNSCWCYKSTGRTNRLATSEEKHWLEICIEADKFISYEEAMKTFISEYVKCTLVTNASMHSKYQNISPILNKIYEVSERSFPEKGVQELVVVTKCGVTMYDKYTKPSTKEAYDAQFKKEIVKVKPFEVLEYGSAKVNSYKTVINEEGNIFMINDMITPVTGINKGKSFKITGFRLNNDKSMICAITDTHNPNGIGIDKIEHFIEKNEFVLPEHWFIKTTIDTFNIIRNWANKKINNDYYNTYIHHNNVNFNYKGLYRREHGCIEITFDQFKKYVLNEQELSPIQLANIQHPKLAIQEETILEKAKRLYPVGTKFKCANNNYPGNAVVTEYDDRHKNLGIFSKNHWIYLKGKWAEIIEDEPKVGDKFIFKKHYYHTGQFTIDKIENSNDGKIIFYKYTNGYQSPHGRVLLKNIKIIK